MAAANPSASDPLQPERADHPEVVALLAELDAYLATLYPPEANHLLTVAELLRPEVHFLAARQGGRVVGCGAYLRRPGEPATQGRPYAEVKRMMVAPACRGQGLGQRLLQALESDAQREGYGLALLETGGEQRQAVQLYERAGYTRRPAFGGYPDNGLSWFYGKALG